VEASNNTCTEHCSSSPSDALARLRNQAQGHCGLSALLSCLTRLISCVTGKIGTGYMCKLSEQQRISDRDDASSSANTSSGSSPSGWKKPWCVVPGQPPVRHLRRHMSQHPARSSLASHFGPGTASDAAERVSPARTLLAGPRCWALTWHHSIDVPFQNLNASKMWSGMSAQEHDADDAPEPDSQSTAFCCPSSVHAR